MQHYGNMPGMGSTHLCLSMVPRNRTVPHLCRSGPCSWRLRFLTPLSRHLEDTHNVDTLRYIILYGIRAGLPPARGMDPDSTGNYSPKAQTSASRRSQRLYTRRVVFTAFSMTSTQGPET
jgi:hypothetical protein